MTTIYTFHTVLGIGTLPVEDKMDSTRESLPNDNSQGNEYILEDN